jgi:hypothetical protein
MARTALVLIALALAAAAAAAPAPTLANAGGPAQTSGLWHDDATESFSVDSPQGYVSVYIAEGAPAAEVALAASYDCAGPQRYLAARDKSELSYTGAALQPPYASCDLVAANATALAFAGGEGAACPAAGAAPAGALARLPSSMPDRSAEACPGGAPAGAAPPALGDVSVPVDVGAAFPPFSSPGGPPVGVGAFASTPGAPGDAFVGLNGRAGAAWAGWAAAKGIEVTLTEYTSHECAGPHAYRVVLANKLFWLNGTVEAFAACEAGRWDPATRTRLVKSSRGACPAVDFAAADATYSNVLFEEVPALGSPDAPCGGGAPAPAPAPASAARAPRAAAAAALLAALAAL